MKIYEFTVVIERDEDGGYVAVVPALQGCYTEGETEQESRDLVEDCSASPQTGLFDGLRK